MVTLTGPAGVGKTRLAQRVASRARRPFRHGVRFVDLSAARDPAEVLDVVAAALRAPARGPQTRAALVDVLAPLRLLLVLDNCEHVLDEVRPLVPAILRDCPGVAVLATSREALRVPDEVAVEVPVLPLPASGETSAHEVGRSPAVELFVGRAARSTRPSS